MKIGMKARMKDSMKVENHHEKCGLESKNFSTHDTLCGEKKIGVCNAKKITKMDRFVVTATI